MDAADNIYITGHRGLMPGPNDNCAFLLKINSSGSLLWNISWISTNPNIESFGEAITLDDDGNIYITGSIDDLTDTVFAFVAKFNSTGHSKLNITWKTPGALDEIGRDIAVDKNGNIFIVGETDGFTLNTDAFLAKFNSTGHSKFNRTRGTSNDDDDWGKAITLDDNGNVYVAGDQNDGLFGFIAKYNNTGDSKFNTTWVTVVSKFFTEDIVLDASDNIYVTGTETNTSLEEEDVFVAKFDNTGHSKLNITWASAVEDYGKGIEVDASGKIYITGKTNSTVAGNDDALLATFDSDGNSLQNFTWGGSFSDAGEGIVMGNNGKVYITGHYMNMATFFDAFVAIYDCPQGTTPSSDDDDDDNDNDKSSTNAIPFGNFYLMIALISITALILYKKKQIN